MITALFFILTTHKIAMAISSPNLTSHVVDSGPHDPYLDFSAFPYDGYVPEGGVGTHDPAVMEFKGHYFCFHTGPGIGNFRSSTNLLHWKTEGPIIDSTPDWLAKAVPHRSVWAPEAIKWGDGLRLYYCASARFGHNESWIAVAECPHFDPEHPKVGWHDLGPIIASKDGDNFNAIDPDVLTDPTGRQWMYFGSYWSGVYAAEIDPATGKMKDPSPAGKTLIARNPADRANGLEAPCGIYHEGYYYLFVNYGLAAQGVASTYQIVVGRSKSPSGPFVDANGVAMTEGGHMEMLSASPPMFGPGGGVAFQDDQGRWLMSYHYYDGRRFWHGHVWGVPTLQIRELLWSPDGWPLPGLPITPETIKLQAKERKSPVGKWEQQASFGTVNPLEIHANGACSLPNQQGTWKMTDGAIEFHWPKLDSPSEFWVDRVQLADGGNYFVGRNQSGMVVRGVRSEKG
jgi:arabinan endo-1,5-alpha-L-arabinosidase